MEGRNLELWNNVRTAPKDALKTIKGGRLNGMSDISPMWRYLELTKAFGPCGVGWKYLIAKLWTEPGADEQVCAFAEIELFIKHGGAWSDAIPGIGGSMLTTKEKAGLHTSDECYKMAVTDALSVACKVLGFAADVYWFAGSKYATARTPEQDPADVIDECQLADLAALITEVKANLKGFLAHYKISSLEMMPEHMYSHACKALEQKRQS